jgi:ABC-type multidrug transport system ATPase subunit
LIVQYIRSLSFSLTHKNQKRHFDKTIDQPVMPHDIEQTISTSNEDGAREHLKDPFAPRNGRHLVWKDVNMTVKLPSNGDAREKQNFILKNVWGEVPPKQLTAIMGPSGSGKTSLLNVLAGRAQSGAKVQVEGDIRLDNYSVNPADIGVRKLIAFVAQDDTLQVTATPREAIHFSAKLRLDRTSTDEELDQLTDHMLQELGLERAADTIIGGSLIKGISGGERKRTSLGVELVVRPTLVFADEPTCKLL